MSSSRPRRRHIPRVLTGLSRHSNRLPIETSRSIFTFIDEYEDEVEKVLPAPPPSMDVDQQQNNDNVSVVNVQDDSDGDVSDEAAARPGFCKICYLQSKKAKSVGEGSSQAAKETILKCAICFSPTSDGGTHHPHAMRCGHIFGKSCIDTWLNAKMPSTCPVCTVASQDALLIHLFVTSARDDVLEDALDKADEVNELKAKHQAEKITLIGLNTMLFNCVKNYVEALAMGCGVMPNP